MTAIAEMPMAAEFRPFWEAVDAGRLCFPCCRACRRFHWYPLTRCPHCRSADIAWTEIAGPAAVYSWTVVSHAFDPAFRDRLPYIVALVEFRDAPGVRLVTNLIDVAPEEVRFDMAVVPAFDARHGAGDPLPFRRIQA